MDPPMPPYSGDCPFAAATLVHDAALALAASADPADRGRYLSVARRMGEALEAGPTRPQVLAASPRVVERSGRVRTLVEMIEDEPEDDGARFRLITLLMRALAWVPAGPSSAGEAVRHDRESIRHQRRVAARSPDEPRELAEG